MDKIKVAVVGCGSFACGMHLPNLQKLSDEYEIYAAVDIIEERARKVNDLYGTKYYTSDYRKVLDDDEVDLVIITTYHNEHGRIVVEAAEADKNILVEKPMTMSLEENDRVMDALAKHKVTLIVGFNRRFAPLSLKAKELISTKEPPFLVNYRAVDEIWGNSWTMDPKIGGGRIFAEACHFFDYFCWLTDAEPIRIYAEGGCFTHPDIPDTQDNAIITVKLTDGSIFALTNGDMGHRDYHKERVEIYCNRAVVMIDNYQYFEAYGFGEKQEINLPSVDKGHLQELRELAQAIREGRKTPINEVNGARATVCCLKAIEAIKTGEPQEVKPSEYIREAN